jgi:hypothetical protein
MLGPRVVVEGRVFESLLEAEVNLTERFVWDRLDVYGRKVFGQVGFYFVSAVLIIGQCS